MAAPSTPRRVKFGDFIADLDSFELRKHGIRIKLQDQPFQILKLLLQRPGQLVTRDEFRMELWTESTFVDFDAGLNAAIRRLRDALNESAEQPRYIETLPRHGYRFIAAVEVDTLPPAAPPQAVQIPAPNGNEQKETEAPELPVPVKHATSRRPYWQKGLLAACLLLGALAVGAVTLRSKLFAHHSSSSQISSIAVLPLENLSGDSSQDYFAEGMTDALITDLAQIKQLHVISRTSTTRFRGSQKKVREIAKELGVDAVLEGAAVRSGDRVRIDAQLIRGDDDVHLWAKSYERDLHDVLALQRDLARAIASEVAVELAPQEQARFAIRRKVSPDVYDAYLKGRYFSNRPMEDGLKKGIAYFREAIRLDPNYAPAYSGLADAYSLLGFVGTETDRPRDLAIEAAEKAIALDDSLAEAHASLGLILHRYNQEWNRAETEYRRAIELNPSYATAHRYYGIFLRGIARDEAGCKELQLAYELDPLNPMTAARWAECIYDSGDFTKAVGMLNGLLEIEPTNLQSLWILGEMYEKKGMFPDAIEQYQKAKDATGGNEFIPYSLLASAYAGSGQATKAEKILREMNRKFGEDKWLSAAVHVRMGQNEQAIRDLTEDDTDCGPGTCGPAASLYITNWRFSPLYPDPRFQALLRKFNYPESALKRCQQGDKSHS